MLSAVASFLLAGSTPGATFRWSATSNRIYVENGGSATLTDIKTALPNAPLEQVDAARGVWFLRANLQIADGATLVLHGSAAGGDVSELRLLSNNSSASNSFVSLTADWGRIDIKSTKILSWDTVANAPDEEFATFGRAFIRVRSRLAADGVTPNESRMDIVDSDISYLGYDASESYGLAWKVTGTHPDPSKSIFDYVNVYGDITGSHLHHSFWGVYSFGLKNGRWLNNEVDHNAGYGFDPHDDTDHLLIEGNNVHHNGGLARGVHGIIASKRCDHVVIRNNRSWANAGNGIMLHRHSDDAVVENNQTYLNGDSGVALFDVDRTAVRNNLMLSNVNAGIRLSVGCADNVIANNEIAYSGENGLLFGAGTDPAEPDPLDSTVSSRNRRNTVSSNYVHDCVAEGVKMTDSDTNLFVGNRFAANAPELSFTASIQTRLEGNSIPPTVTVALAGSATVGCTTFFKQQPLVKLTLADVISSATFEDDDGAIFDFDQARVATRVDPQHSFVTVTSAEIGGGTTVVTRDFLVKPNSGEASVNPTLWGPGAESAKQWTSQATVGSASIHYTIGGLAPNRSYAVMKGGETVSAPSSDPEGFLSFADSPGTTAMVQYGLTPTNQPPVLPTVAVVATDASASEAGPDPGTFTISRTGSTSGALTVRYTVGGTATSGSDYAPLPGNAVIPAGSASAVITVNPINDSLVEGSESVVLTLAADPGYAIGSPNSGTVTIADDDQAPTLPTVSVVATDASASETGRDPGTFTISRTGNTSGPLTVRCTVGGTATSGSDYAPLPGNIVIPAGNSSAVITVSPVNDSLVEGSETVVLTLAADPAYAIGSPNSATVTIADDDQAPTLPTVSVAATDASASETGPNPGTFTISRTGSTSSALTVRYAVGGSASNGEDYTTLSGSVVIAAGQATATVTVQPINDDLTEGTEQVILSLSAEPAYAIGTPSNAVVAIADNDRGSPRVSVEATVLVCSESAPDPGTFSISRTGNTRESLTVHYVLGGTAVNGTDYAALPGVVTIPAGARSTTVEVRPIDDTLLEVAELVLLTITADDAYSVGVGVAIVTILDNDLLILGVPPLTPPALAISAPVNGRVSLAWLGTLAQLYRVQYNSDGSATHWVDLGANLTTTNGVVMTSDAIVSDERRFYRLVLLP
jgi:parallel beta-helix repeat protein